MILAVTLTALSAGCDRHTKHKVLTFFFTGVPPLEGEQNTASASTQGKTGKHAPVVTAFIHGPKAAGQCYQCHETSNSLQFKGTGGKPLRSFGKSRRTGITGRLVTPLKDLCTECHTSKSAESVYMKELWLHGPVASGNCTACHDPHSSSYEYMLLEGRSPDLCTRCHTGEFMLITEDHTASSECVSCHNAHMGKNRFLLKKDYDEIF